MDPKSGKSIPLFVNPFMLWTDLAFKTGQAMLESAHAAAARSNTAAKVAVIPTADAPAPRAREAANAKIAVLPAADAPRQARAAVRHASKAARFKTARAKLRSKANAKRRAKR